MIPNEMGAPIFVNIMVIFENSQDAMDTQSCIDQSDARKYSETRTEPPEGLIF